MAEVENKQSTLKKTIVDLTTQYWEQHGRALLLASLGQALTKRGFNVRAELRGRKLAAFIEHELADQVAILTSPYDPLVRGAVPVSAAQMKPLEEVFARRTMDADGGERPIRFNQAMWAAFSRPISPGYVRVIDLEPRIHFEDVPSASPLVREKLSIPAELVIPPDKMQSENRQAELQKNIRKWLKDRGLDIDLAKAEKRSGLVSQGEAFWLLAHTLDRGDLQRISVPLDVVLKLIERTKQR